MLKFVFYIELRLSKFHWKNIPGAHHGYRISEMYYEGSFFTLCCLFLVMNLALFTFYSLSIFRVGEFKGKFKRIVQFFRQEINQSGFLCIKMGYHMSFKDLKHRIDQPLNSKFGGLTLFILSSK